MATMYYRPYTTEPIKDVELPTMDAMETILPEYKYIFMDPGDKPHIRPVADPDPIPPTILDYQMVEIERYRAAVQKMGQDILSLRQHVRDLEVTNSNLRRELTHYDDATRYIVDSPELEGLTRSDVILRYASLKQKLATSITEQKTYKDKVQKLQNEIIKKNDTEKGFLHLQHAHASQQALVQKLQDRIHKVKTLEETCRKQERVIETMEKLVEKHKDKRNKDSLAADTQAALLAENKRLRQELEDNKGLLRNSHGSTKDDLERLDLYQALDRAEGRVMSLEKQLADNSRQWGRERANLSLRLNEAKRGLGDNYTLRVDNLTKKRDTVPRRYSKHQPQHRFSPTLDPLY